VDRAYISIALDALISRE